MEDKILVIIITIAISLIKLGQGFSTNIKTVFLNQSKFLVLRSIAAVILLVPLLFLILIFLIRPRHGITEILMIMALAPAADLSIRQVGMLGGDVKLAEVIQMTSALLSIITTPLLLYFFKLTVGFNLEINYWSLIRNLAVAQFIPMLIGISLYQFFPHHKRTSEWISRIAGILLAIAFLWLMIVNIKFFALFNIPAYTMIIFATASAAGLGALIAGKKLRRQISVSIETGLRNPGLAILIASQNFDTVKVHAGIIPYIATTGITIAVFITLLKYAHRFK